MIVFSPQDSHTVYNERRLISFLQDYPGLHGVLWLSAFSFEFQNKIFLIASIIVNFGCKYLEYFPYYSAQ